MKNIVFIASHVGYPMDRTPLGGGAMVGLQLIRHWAERDGLDFRLTVLGSGPVAPLPGVVYRRLPGRDIDLVHLSEFGYARFCRDFERSVTDHVAAQRGRLPPEDTCIVVNDISEGPDIARLSRMGYPVVSIWHVDVVDFFNKLYLKNLLPPERLTAAFELARKPLFGWAVPDVLRLIFDKQRKTVLFSDRLILPSRMMAETVRRCYRHLYPGRDDSFEERALVVPWGGWSPGVGEEQVERQAARLRAHYQLGPDTLSLMTLSRLSPEKGIDLLLKALSLLESSAERPARDLCLFICGEHAFMKGAAFYRRLRAAASKLNFVRVFFPGYLGTADKQAFFRIADLFVSASIHESYGLTIVEALQAGLPVLASDHYGVEEILRPEFGRRVRYSQAKDIPRALAAELAAMLRCPEDLKMMGRSAKRAARDMSFAKSAGRISEVALYLAGGADRRAAGIRS